MIARSKFYFFDVGVFHCLRPKGILDRPEEISGLALETLFLQSLLAVNDYFSLDYTIYFWRTAHGAEVDFVAYGHKGLYAFEIKHSGNLTPKAFRHLRLFKEDYPMAQLYLIAMVERQEHHGDITVLPIEQALRALPQLLADSSNI